MAEPLITHLTSLFREQLDNKSSGATQQMVAGWLKVEAALKDDLLKLATDLNQQPQPLKPSQLARLERYVRLLAQTQREIERFTGQTALPVIQELKADAALAGIQQALTLIDATLSLSGGSAVDFTFDRLNVEAVQNIVAISGAGKPLGDLLQAAYPLAVSGLTDALIQGAARGRSPRETARLALSQGLAQSLSHILLVARDQQNRAVREGARQQYLKAGIAGYRRLATRQTRTCFACLALDGQVFPTAELMPLHAQDRCTMLPLVPGFAPVPIQTGEEWFGTLSPDTQRQMMGPGKYEAWKAGKFTFGQLVTVKPNRTWGPSAQVTSLKDLLGGSGGFQPPPLPRPQAPQPPPTPAAPAQPLPSPLPALDHDLLEQLDLHQVGPKWGKQANYKSQSYGGIIFDEQGRVLLRKPTGGFGGLAWTFPKGKMDSPSEHPVQTALREVEQETGHSGQIIGLLPGQYKGDTGRNNYFLMKSAGFDKSKMDDETEDLIWATWDEAEKLIKQGINQNGVDRDLKILTAATLAYGDLETGFVTNDYLFKQHKSKPVVITTFSDALNKDLKKQATAPEAKAALTMIKQNGKGMAVLDDKGAMKGLLSFDDTEDDYLVVPDIWAENAASFKTALINAGKLAAKQGKGIKVIAQGSKIAMAAAKLGFSPNGLTYSLKPEWMGDWKKAPTKFTPPAAPPPPPSPKAFDRKTILPGDPKADNLKQLAQADLSDPLALKGAIGAADKIKAGQKGFAYGDPVGGQLKGVISYEEQPTIIKVGSAGFIDFDTNLAGLKDVVKVAKGVGKDLVTFAPTGKVLDQYLKWGFEVSSPYANGASLILKKQTFDSWLKDPEAYGKNKPAPALTPTPGGYAPPPQQQQPSSTFKATPKPRQVEPLPKAEPLPEPDGFPPNPEILTVVRRLGGSTGAELVEDAAGNRYVRKRGASSEHVQEEAYADAAYTAAGANVPRFKIYTTPGGPVKLAEFIEGETLGAVLKKGGARAKAAREEVQKLFAADALFSNRDVVGLDYDNILVDKSGKVWRIDNGGSFRFRAQGARKSDWDEYATDLWTLRDKATNQQTADLFGSLDFYTISDQILELQSRRRSILAAVPEEIQDTLDRRLKNLTDMAQTAKAMQPDNFKVAYADSFSRSRMEIRRTGLSEQMPLAMGVEGYSKATAKERYTGNGINTSEVYDEQGRKFDRLRGSNSLVTHLRDFVSKVGGDYQLIIKWAEDQAGNSWNPRAQAFKYHLVQSMVDKQDNLFWWRDGKKAAEGHYKQYAKNADVYRKTFEALHAFTQELLSRMDLPNKNDNGTITLLRTEDKHLLQNLYGFKPGQKGLKIPRGPVESTSIFDAVYIGTSEVVRQEVPLHRIIATYFMERNPGQGGDLLLGDHENEFVAILGGDQAFDYVASKRGSVVAIP